MIKRILLTVALLAGPSFAFASITATMVGIDEVQPAENGTSNVGVLVVLSGPEMPNGKTVIEEILFPMDFSQTVNQIQSALAAGIRAAVLAQFGQTIPTNGVNVMSFTKG